MRHIVPCSVILAGLSGCMAHGSMPETLPHLAGATLNTSGAPCQVYQVFAGDMAIGSAFALADKDGIIVLTAHHVVRGQDIKMLRLVSPCRPDKIQVTDVAMAQAQDIAALTVMPGQITAGFKLGEKPVRWGTSILIPGYASFERISIQVAGRMIPAEGRVIGSDDGRIITTANVIHKGSSGSPVLDSQGQLIGLITSQVLIEGNIYSGVSHGQNQESIRAAVLGIRVRS